MGGDEEEVRHWISPSLLYASDLVLYSESDEDPRAVVGPFVRVHRKRGLKINAGKNKVMALGRDEELEGEVCVDGIQLDHLSEFKYLGYDLDELGTGEAVCCRKLTSGRRVAGAIRFLGNARDLQLECGRVLHESLLVPALMYGSKTMI